MFLEPPNPARGSPLLPFAYRPSRVVLPHTLHSYISSPRGITSGSGTVFHDVSRAPQRAQLPPGDTVDPGSIVGTGFAFLSIHRAHTVPFLSFLICTHSSLARCWRRSPHAPQSTAFSIRGSLEMANRSRGLPSTSHDGRHPGWPGSEVLGDGCARFDRRVAIAVTAQPPLPCSLIAARNDSTSRWSAAISRACVCTAATAMLA